MKRVWGITTVALLALTGCASTTVAAPVATKSIPASSPSATERSQEQKDALWAYVKAEEATVPNLMANMPGVYSEITVEGTFETVKKSRHLLSDGIHAVVWFDYTYVPDYDLSVAYQQTETSKAQIDQLCETAIFPRMRALGVDPPLGATFTYRAAHHISPVNTLWCSASR